ncbi:uncharacterized protein [Linepithema humile]|uniref:uncharacterized protein n=1 Tax=Linepithema humile TaxID=83485 RepID=UPI00351E336A
MKSASFFLVCCLFATGFAKPAVFLGYQDSLGQYSFGYSAPGSARSEVRTANGATRGTYSYIDETGVIQTTQYIADGEHGFQVIATNLPQAPLPVQDTPEVVAARTAHLQALELAARRDEEAQNQEIQENAQERKIEGNQSNALLSRSQEPEAKSVENRQQKVEQKVTKSAENVELKENSDETLQAVASKSGVDKESEKLQGAHEESSGKASQEILHDANVPVIPLISTHERLPQSLVQPAMVPIFRISLGNQEIEPSAIPESSIVQGASGIVTPAGTALKSGAILTKEAATPEKKQQPASEQAHAVNTLFAPLSTVPLSSSSFIRYASPVSLYYVTYNTL